MQNQVVSQGMVRGSRLEVRELYFAFPGGWWGSHLNLAKGTSPAERETRPDNMAAAMVQARGPFGGAGPAYRGQGGPVFIVCLSLLYACLSSFKITNLLLVTAVRLAGHWGFQECV